MKKIIVAGTFLLTFTTGTSFGQSNQVALNTDKNELKLEQKDLRAKEKELRKEDRSYDKTQVSYFTRNRFATDFPNAQNVNYRSTKYFDEVYYTLDGVPYTAYYDNTDGLVGTTTDKQMSDLPGSAQKDIAKSYERKGYSIDRVVLYDDNEANDTDMWLYGSRFDDQDVYFVELSKDGKTSVLEVYMDGSVDFFMNLKN